MVYKTLDAVNTSQGIHTIFVYVNEITGGIFTRLFLLSFFLVLSGASYLSMKRLKGNADLPSHLAIGAFITSGASIIMSFIPGLIHPFDIVVSIAGTILFVLWMFMSNVRE